MTIGIGKIHLHLDLEGRLLKLRWMRDHGHVLYLECPGMERVDEESDILSQMEQLYRSLSEEEILVLENERLVIQKGPLIAVQKEKTYDHMPPPDLRALTHVVATEDSFHLLKGQQGFKTDNGVRVFVPTNFSYEGVRLYKCFDCDPGSSFWRRA